MKKKDFAAATVALIGESAVIQWTAAALATQIPAEKLLLIGPDRQYTEGTALDLRRALAFDPHSPQVCSGSYEDCSQADLIILTAASSLQSEENTLSRLAQEIAALEDRTEQIMAAGFDGMFLVAAKPVGIMTSAVARSSGLPPHRILGSGTVTDTVWLRHLLGHYFLVDPRSIHAYVLGEPEGGGLIPWSLAQIAAKPLLRICDEHPDRFRYEDLIALGEEVRDTPRRLSETGKTPAGCGDAAALARIASALLRDEQSVLPVTSLLEGEYGQNGVWTATPCVLGRGGVESKLCLPLTASESERLAEHCDQLRDHCLRLWKTL